MATTLLAAAAKSAAGPQSTVTKVVNALPQIRTNVSPAERAISLVAGGAVSALGFDGRGPTLISSLLGGFLLYRAATGNCPAYQLLGVSMSDATAEHSSVAAGHGTRVEHSITVQKPIAEVYQFWRDFENFPRFMTHLLDVDTTTDGQSHWVARGPLGIQVEWDAKIIADKPNKMISWQSLDGADVDSAGSVHFIELPFNGGTEVRVELKYDPPAGKLGTAVAWLFGKSPDAQIRADMLRFKQIMEAGTVRATTTEGQPHGER